MRRGARACGFTHTQRVKNSGKRRRPESDDRAVKSSEGEDLEKRIEIAAYH